MILSWLRKLLRKPAPVARPRCRFRPSLESLSEVNRCRPEVEILEERCLLASSFPLAANLTPLTVTFTGLQETPSEQTAAQGTGTVTYNSTTNTVDVDVSVTGIAAANVTAFHFHRAPTGVAGPVILGLQPGFGTFVTSGNGIRFTAQNIPFPAAFVSDLLRQNVYLNIHTTAFRGGEVRGQVLPERIIAVGADAGGGGTVAVFNADGSLRTGFLPFGLFPTGVRVATGDVNGDGVEDIIAAPGPGVPGSPVFVFSGRDLSILGAVLSFPGNLGGVSVAAGDVNGDGRADIIAGAPGGGVLVFSGQDFSLLRGLLAFPGTTGSINVGAADLNGDGKADIIVGTGPGAPGGGVQIFSGADGSLLRAFLAFNGFPSFTGGVFVTGGAVNNNHAAGGRLQADIIVGTGPGAGSLVAVFDARSGLPTAAFSPFGAFGGGTRVTGTDINGDSRTDIVAGTGFGSAQVEVFQAPTLNQLLNFFAFPGFTGGIFPG